MLNTNARIIFIFITILIDAIGIGLVSPILPDVIRKFGSDEAFVNTYFGYFISVYSLMLFIASPLLGALADKFGRRPILLIALCGAGLDYLLMAFAPNLTLLFIGRIVAGLSGASMTVAMSYIADVSNEKNRTSNFGMIGAAFGLGFIIGPAIGGIVGSYGHHWPFIIAALMSLTNFIFGVFILPESLPKDKRIKTITLKSLNPLNSVYNILFKSNYRALIWAFFLFQIAVQAHASVWSLYTHLKFGWTAMEIGLSLTFVGLFLSIGQGITTRIITPRIGDKKAIVMGLAVLALNLLVFGLATQVWVLYVCIAAIMLTSLAGPSLQSMIAKDTATNEQGKLQGTLVSLMSLSSIFGPLIYTNLFSVFTTKGAFYFPGAPYVGASVICVLALVVANFKIAQET